MANNDIAELRRLRAENDALSKAIAALAEFKRRAEARIEKLEAALRGVRDVSSWEVEAISEAKDIAREALEGK